MLQNFLPPHSRNISRNNTESNFLSETQIKGLPQIIGYKKSFNAKEKNTKKQRAKPERYVNVRISNNYSSSVSFNLFKRFILPSFSSLIERAEVATDEPSTASLNQFVKTREIMTEKSMKKRCLTALIRPS